MAALKKLQSLARRHGTPLFVVDHKVLRQNYALFKKHLPRVQAYYAVKANPAPEIVRTMYEIGASFDVASIAEFPRRPQEHRGAAGQTKTGFHLGQDDLRQSDQGHGDARKVSWTNTSRW